LKSSIEYFPDLKAIETQITNYSGQSYDGVAIWSPASEPATLLYSSLENIDRLERYTAALDIVTNRIANSSRSTGTARQVYTSLQNLRHPVNEVSYLSLPITALLILAFICATSISVSLP
jgi:hypothetical protein